MAGVKGRSGRKPRGWVRDETQPGGWVAPQDPEPPEANFPAHAVEPVEFEHLTPLQFLERAMNDPRAPLKERLRAAIAAAQYRHAKRGESGKKEDAAEKAKKASEGRFSPSAPPRLVAAGGKRTG